MCQISLFSALFQCIYFILRVFFALKKASRIKSAQVLMKKTLQKLHEQEKLSFCRGNLTRVTRLNLLLKTSVSPDKYQKIAPCKGIQDSLWILLRGFLIPGTKFPLLCHWNNRQWHSESQSCIPDSKAQDFKFHKQKFPRFLGRRKRTNKGQLTLWIHQPFYSCVNDFFSLRQASFCL